ncbi:MAG: hypothetical protein WAU28_04195 [Candidatus Moraniibacteriota bacterium]
MVFISASAEDALSGKNIFQDSDSDGLSNEEERLYGTDPFIKDTDGDGYSDGVEVKGGYNPLKKAPGDRIVIGGSNAEDTTSTGSVASKENLTQKISTEVAKMVSEKGTNSSDVSLSDLDSAVSTVLSSSENIILPIASIDEIKIKPLTKKEKKLSASERKKVEEEYIVEYLTSMAYIMANNSPSTFQTEDQLQSIASNVADQSNNALLLGDFSYISDLSKNGERMLEQIKEVEVPESMVDMHLKALQMAKYAVSLKDELIATKNNMDDPLQNIATLSKIQGFLNVSSVFATEFGAKLTSYGITTIPLEL